MLEVVLEVVPKVLGDCAEGARRLCRRCLEVVPKVVQVAEAVLEVPLKVLGGCAEGGAGGRGCAGGYAERGVGTERDGGCAKSDGGAEGAWKLCSRWRRSRR